MKDSYIPARVLTQDDAMALGKRLLATIGDVANGVLIEHRVSSVFRTSQAQVLSSHDGEEVSVHWDASTSGGIPLSLGTNQFNDASVTQMLTCLKDVTAPSNVAWRASLSFDDSDQQTFLPRSHLPVHLWHESTVTAMASVRDTVIPSIIEHLRHSTLMCVATVGVTARATLYLYRDGLVAWGQETDSEMTMTARTSDGTASGWSGQANRDWSLLQPSTIAARAIEGGLRSQRPVAVEPGRWTVILGPAAVAQLVRVMTYMFDARKTDEQWSMPFHYEGPNGRRNKIGMRVIDPRLNFVSDPAESLGGFFPFFEVGGSGTPGLPISKMTWIQEGTLANLAYAPTYAAERGKLWGELPYSARLTASVGTQTHTVEEMIAQCEAGIYVNRFSNVALLDGANGLATGVTRDGCFLIRHGKIRSPIKNFRFLESPLFALNHVRAIGVAERVALGYAPPANRSWSSLGSWPPLGRDVRWPFAPVIAPPLMVDDFNFVSLSSAV